MRSKAKRDPAKADLRWRVIEGPNKTLAGMQWFKDTAELGAYFVAKLLFGLPAAPMY